MRSNDLEKEIFNFKAIHGQSGLSFLVENGFKKIPKISDKIRVVSVTNFNNNPFTSIYENSENIKYTCLKLDNFRCFLDKVQPVKNYLLGIKEPYVLYFDHSDACLVNDILYPESILHDYNCKILFNAEEGSSMPGTPCEDKSYLERYKTEIGGNYYKVWEECMDFNKDKLRELTGLSFNKTLNAGLFLGETEYIIECLEKIELLMLDDPMKGFPYGEVDDQVLWHYLQYVNDDSQIQIDYKNLHFLWVFERKFGFPPDHWEHFNYFLHNGN